MAQRDYVKKKGNNKKPSRVIPNLMMAIAIILVVIFIAILYVVSNNKPSRTSQPVKVTPKPETTLPSKPQERWSYIKELENPDSVAPVLSGEEDQTHLAQERQQALDAFRETTTSKPKQVEPVVVAKPVTVKPERKPVPAAKPTTNKSGKYIVQCGAFKASENAKALKAQIAMAGLSSTIQSQNLHRVILGPYSSKSQAQTSLNQLQKNNIKSCIITTAK